MIGSLLKPLIGSALGPLLDKIPDVNERRRLEHEAEQRLLEATTGLVQAQIAVNMKEAEHSSIFVAGWRPAIGWICGAGLAWEFVIRQFVVWVAFLNGVDVSDPPVLDTGTLMTLLLGMLGIAGMRTYEKQIGCARSKV
jgi:hypothetical protein